MMQDSGKKSLQCGICLEEQPEDCIASHQAMCMVRMVFQCTHCNGDFLSKEGLWNHLDMHEVTDESKHFNYQEVKIRHKLLKCDVCNDQRGYSESSYWKHVHEVHSWILQMHTSGSLPNSAGENISNPVHMNPLEGQQNATTKETNGKIMENIKSTTRNTRHPRQKILDSKSNEDPAEKLIEVNETSNAAEEVLAKKSQILVENPLICPHCGKASTNLLSAAVHINDHTLTWCDICNITIHGRWAAYYHKSKNHTEPLYECDKCSRKFLKKSMVNYHRPNCKGVRNNTIATNQTAYDDLDTKMKIEEEETQLTPCESTKKASTIDDSPEANQYEKRREAGALTHEDTCLLSAEPKLSQESGPEVVKVNSASEKSYIKCSFCKDMLPDHVALTKHILYQHVPAPCDICGLTLVNIIRLRYHKRSVHFQTKYSCRTCSTKYTSKKRYEKHLLLCTKNDVTCDVCGRELKTLASLRKHAVCCQAPGKTTNKVSKLKCPDCGRLVRGAEALSKHRTENHSKFNCDICGITIVGKYNCKLHMYTMHTNKSFECKKCSKIFIRKRAFEAHVPVCAQRNTSCNLCWKMCRNSESLRRHRLNAHRGKNLTVENIRDFLDAEAQQQNAVEEMQPDKPASDCGSSSALQTVLKHQNNNDDSQLDVREGETNSTSPQDENITIEMDIKVEDSVLQE